MEEQAAIAENQRKFQMTKAESEKVIEQAQQLIDDENITATFNHTSVEEKKDTNTNYQSRNRYRNWSPNRDAANAQIKDRNYGRDTRYGRSVAEDNNLDFKTPEKKEYLVSKKKRGFASNSEQVVNNNVNKSGVKGRWAERERENLKKNNEIVNSEYVEENDNGDVLNNKNSNVYSSFVSEGMERSSYSQKNRDNAEFVVRSPSKLVRDEIFEKFDLKEKPNTVTAFNNMTNQFFSSNITYKNNMSRKSVKERVSDKTSKEQLHLTETKQSTGMKNNTQSKLSNEKNLATNFLNESNDYSNVKKSLDFNKYNSPYSRSNNKYADQNVRSPSKEVREDLFDKFDLKEKPNTVTASPERRYNSRFEQSFYNENGVNVNKEEMSVYDCNSKYRSKYVPKSTSESKEECYLEETNNYGRSEKRSRLDKSPVPNQNTQMAESDVFNNSNIFASGNAKYETRMFRSPNSVTIGRFNNSKRDPSRERIVPETRGVINHTLTKTTYAENFSDEQIRDRGLLSKSRENYRRNMMNNSSTFERRHFTYNLEEHEVLPDLKTPTYVETKEENLTKKAMADTTSAKRLKTPKKEIVQDKNGNYKRTSQNVTVTNTAPQARSRTPKSKSKKNLFDSIQTSVKRDKKVYAKKSRNNTKSKNKDNKQSKKAFVQENNMNDWNMTKTQNISIEDGAF